MPSLIPGFEYDIFISYRQKDNKHDGWVTEFVNQLKGEVEATFKEDISIYFDENPSDGLLETHSVDKSLEGKLRCLIFIPIISRTYCDPKSYAWQHEFCAFNKLAKEDRFGRDIRLSSGNVASRILPIKIHDLDPEDKSILENELGGVLRCIEFIYKSAGVNRPLTPSDNPDKNLNKTFYRDQINKVANAVKEIITAIRKQNKHPDEVIKQVFEKKSITLKSQRTKIIAGSVIVLLLIIFGFFIILQLFKSREQVGKSIAILPFEDNSPIPADWFANGIVEDIYYLLVPINDLDAIPPTSSRIYHESKLSLREIARRLDVSTLLEGSVLKEGNRIRINVRLIDGKTEKPIWSKSYDKEWSDYYSISKDITVNIVKELQTILTIEEEDLISQVPTKSPIANESYLISRQYYREGKRDIAIKVISEAIDQDPYFALAYAMRAGWYSALYFTKGEYYSGKLEDFDQLASADMERALQLSPDDPNVKYRQAQLLYQVFNQYDEALKMLDEIGNQMSSFPGFYVMRSYILRRKGRLEESFNEMNKAIHLDSLNVDTYIENGLTCRLLRRYPEAIQFFNRPLELGILTLRPEDKCDRFMTILLWKGDSNEALKISGFSDSDKGYQDYYGNSYYYYSKEFDKLISVSEKVENQWKYFPRTLNLAQAYYYSGNMSMAKLFADSAIMELNLKITEFPKDERYFAALGYAYAYIANNKKALESAQKAIQLMPVSFDAWKGFEREKDLANIYILTGEYDLAMDIIEYLLTIPGDLSVQMLKVDPAYDKLRDLPRFQKILSTEYITNYK